MTVLSLVPPEASAQAGPGKDFKMTDTDSSNATPQRPRLRDRLPALLDLRIERIPFTPQKYRFVRSALAEVDEVIAFRVRLDGALPRTMDATPVLFVGQVELPDVEDGEKGHYTFIAFPKDWQRLEKGAPIALGWPGMGPETRSKFRYSTPR
ncbi:hypothetical protein MAXJ12_30697 [Mesorhizobium alhagi CCNWXJ12-2]|uniref:Uncharacterized protein n=2 Tax=Allomesorhizobium alhagi TaxID=475067 RepID=H0I102_9HYPH|nr:hypothetical protein MAXJ12_30697 [Mesorhizobium alhagi CCNWXJ12-2]